MSHMLRFAFGILILASLAKAEIQQTNTQEFERHIKPFLAKHCADCHGAKKKKADFFVHDIDGLVTNGKDVVRWEKILEMVSIGDMPPEDEPQPEKIERNRIIAWISKELEKIGRGQDVAKLALPHQANRIDHEELFSGKRKGPAFSPARLWRKSPQIYSRFAREMRTKVSQPLLGLGGHGIQDYASLVADESTIKTMLRNANLIAENMVSKERTHQNRFLNPLFKEGAEPKEEDIENAIANLFLAIFQREPTQEDRQRYIEGLFQKNRKLGGLRMGMKSLIVGMVMSQEFVFRLEVGLGEKLADGRRMLGPQEVAYALSFAFYDQADNQLVKLANEGKLSTKEDVAREVKRILDEEDDKKYWHYPMYHRWGEDYYHHRPRVLRFFQEYFGYTGVVDVFKDKERNGEHHANRLRKDADMFVLNVLEQDKDVLANLLTSNRYPLDYFKDDKLAKLLKGSNDRQLKSFKVKYKDQFDEIVKSGKWPGMSTRHVSAYNIDQKTADAMRRGPGELIELPKEQRAGILTHPAWLVAYSGNFDNDPIRRGKWIREHLLGGMIPEVPIGVDARIPENPHRTLRERLDIIREETCWRCHKKMNPLGEVFESYDDFGRYRERIILGDSDAYFKELRQYKGRKAKTEQDLRDWRGYDAKARAQKVKRAEEELAKLEEPKPGSKGYKQNLKRYTNSKGRWTKEREKWLKVDDAEQQRKIAELEKALAELKEPEPELAKPAETSGALSGTGDPALDGPVRDAIDLTHRLAKSERVRQTFVRHAFRYWMGRNETLDDSPTLIAADRAYVENGGSFKAMLISLLSSDSFLYRK